MNNNIIVQATVPIKLVDLANELLLYGYTIVPLNRSDSTSDKMNSGLMDLAFKYSQQLEKAKVENERLKRQLKEKNKVINKAIKYVKKNTIVNTIFQKKENELLKILIGDKSE